MSIKEPSFRIVTHKYIQVGEHEFKLRLLINLNCPTKFYEWRDLESFNPADLEGNRIIHEYMIENNMVDDPLYEKWYKALPKYSTPQF